jgi:hypothetical protein
MTLLQPGDLVNIIVGESEPREQPGSPGSTSPSGERLPVGRGADHRGTGHAVAD